MPSFKSKKEKIIINKQINKVAIKKNQSKPLGQDSIASYHQCQRRMRNRKDHHLGYKLA